MNWGLDSGGFDTCHFTNFLSDTSSWCLYILALNSLLSVYMGIESMGQKEFKVLARFDYFPLVCFTVESYSTPADNPSQIFYVLAGILYISYLGCLHFHYYDFHWRILSSESVTPHTYPLPDTNEQCVSSKSIMKTSIRSPG